jgi:hypothetical protein
MDQRHFGKPDPDLSEKPDAGPHQLKSSIRIQLRIKFKIQELRRLKLEPWRAVDAPNGDVEWRVTRPVVADSHHFDEDPDPHQGGKSNPDPQQSEKLDTYRMRIKMKTGIRNRINVMRIHKTDF